jgi:signal transduction histidine kinase
VKTRGKPLQTLRRVYVGFMFVAIAIICFILMSERAYFNSVNTLNDLHSMGQANVVIDQTFTELLEAERQMNEYLRNGERTNAATFRLTVQRADATLELFTKYTQESIQSNGLLLNLKGVAQNQLADMTRAVEAKSREQLFTEKVPSLASVAQLREIHAKWVASEANYIGDQRMQMMQSLALIRVGVVTLGIICVLALYYFIVQSNELEKQRKSQREAISFERDRLLIEVANRTSQLTELTQHLQSAIEDERSRLARNLHDELGSLLTSAKLDAARIKVRLHGDAPEALDVLSHLVETLNNGIALGRKIIEDLRPSALTNLGLVAALEILIREFSASSGVVVHRELDDVKLDPEIELVAYRIVQEALTNVARYAQAQEIWVTVTLKAESIEIVVRDKGIGFDPTKIRKSAYGLLGMRFRVEAQGGTLSVLSSSMQGATIKAIMPLFARQAGRSSA